MKKTLFNKGYVLGIFALFFILAFIPSYNALFIKDEKVFTNTESSEYSITAYLFGRIENLSEDEYQKSFNAVNLLIVSLVPFGIYHLNSGEKVHIDPTSTPPFRFIIHGILTDNIIFVYCQNVGW